jgi:hypothetical protein
LPRKRQPFFNTVLRMAKVQSVTGHLTMKEHYTHFDTRQFNEIREVQATLLTDGKDSGSSSPSTKQRHPSNTSGTDSKEKALIKCGGVEAT